MGLITNMKKIYFLLSLSILSLSCSSGNYFVTPEHKDQLFNNCLLGNKLSYLHLSIFKSGNSFEDLLEKERRDTIDKVYNIRNIDFQKYLDENYSECLEIDSSYIVHIEPIIYFDLDKDGKDEAVITAQTCMMGTGGPDIHSVFYLDTSGNIREYEIDYNPNKNTKITGTPMPLIGNRNYYLQVKDSLLCAVYWDGSGRKYPLSQYFKFENGKFILEKEVYGKTFPTSFDCSKAQSDREIVACSCDSIAEMDVELDSLYKLLLSKLNHDDKSRLIKEQLQWLQDFDKVYAYKWLDEFAEKYRARITELKNKLVPR